MKRRKRHPGRKGHYHTGTYLSSKGAGECRYRSGWELTVMQLLDDDKKVASWSYEKVIIPYVSNVRTGKIRRYFPDFFVEYVDGTRRLLEVKPSRRVHQPKVAKKLSAAHEWCRANGCTLDVITEHELRAIGAL
jgi:hypothetical protein